MIRPILMPWDTAFPLPQVAPLSGSRASFALRAHPADFIAPEDGARPLWNCANWPASTAALQLAPDDERRAPGQARMSASRITRAWISEMFLLPRRQDLSP
jgi:hypothetical protein